MNNNKINNIPNLTLKFRAWPSQANNLNFLV